MSRAQAHHQPCPCGAELADECPRCASINPLGSMRIVQPYRPGDEADLAPVHDAALPKGASGAWIREAVERLFTPGAPDNAQRMVDEEEDWA